MKSQGNHSMRGKRGHEEEHKGLISQPETGCTVPQKISAGEDFQGGADKNKGGENRKQNHSKKQQKTNLQSETGSNQKTKT